MKQRFTFIAKGATLTGLLLAGLLLSLTQPASAIFGFGDVVFDPTSYATLGHIWTEDISNGAKLVQEFNQLVKIYTNGMQMYQLAQQMSQRFSHPQKQSWMTALLTGVNDYTQNQYGETANWPTMVNGHPSLAPSAWATATVPVSHTSFLSGEIPGSSRLLAHLATVEAQDGSATKCLATMAQYRANAQDNLNAIANLQSAHTDDSANTNSNIQQLNLINAAQQQAANEMRSQGRIQACLAEQQVLANKVQRDAAADHLSFLGEAADYQQSETTAWTGASAAISGYRLP
jgi:type IV secretion system protein TrbJ